MKYAEIKKLPELSEVQLQEKLDEFRKHQFGFRMQKGLGQLGQTHVMRETRRDIARIQTCLRQKRPQGDLGL